MESPVLELQVLAQSSSHKLSDLLRKALVVATKLDLDEFRLWIEKELKGYPTTEVPDYRRCSSEYFYIDDYRRLQPITMPNPNTRQLFSELCICDSVECLQHALEEESKDGSVVYGIGHELEKMLRKDPVLSKNELVRIVSVNALSTILDSVRTTILQWALQLEKDGVLGEGIVFSSGEKEKAQASQVFHISNFNGVFGNVSQSDVRQTFTTGINPGDMGALLRAMGNIGATAEDVAELQAAVIQEPLGTATNGFGARVSCWVGKMVGRAAEGGLKIAVDTSSAVITAALKSYYGLS